MSIPLDIIASEILVSGLKKLPLVGPAIEIIEAVRLRHELIGHKERFEDIENQMSRFERAQRDLVANEIRAALTTLGQPHLDGPTLAEEIRNLRQIREQGWEPTLFEGLISNSSHWTDLRKDPNIYGRVLSDGDCPDLECFHIFIDADKTRLLEVRPYVLAQLLGRQAKGVPTAMLLTSRDIWAFPHHHNQGGGFGLLVPNTYHGASGVLLEAVRVDVMLGRKDSAAGNVFVNHFINQRSGYSQLLALITPNLPCKPATMMVPMVPLANMKQCVNMYGPVQYAVAKAVSDVVADCKTLMASAEDYVCVCELTVNPKADDNACLVRNTYGSVKMALNNAVADIRHQHVLPKDVLLPQFQIGTALVGEGNELAHIDMIVGNKDDIVGTAYRNALATNHEGHPVLIAEISPGRVCSPDTVILTKVTSVTARQKRQMEGIACQAVGRAIADCVHRGVISKEQTEQLGILCGVFIHPAAENKDKIYKFNFEAVKAAVARAVQGLPTVQEVIQQKDHCKHPFVNQ